MCTVDKKGTQGLKRPNTPPTHCFGASGFNLALKQRTSVLEVLFSVGFGGGDAVKRFIEDGDDAMLLR